VRRFLATWLWGGFVTVVLLAAITGGGLKNGGWWRYLRLTRSGIHGAGLVDRTERENHCLAEYVFMVDGRQFRGVDNDCEATVGQKVEVTYLPTEPSVSCRGTARQRLYNELVTLVFGGVMFPPIVMAVWGWRKHRGL